MNDRTTEILCQMCGTQVVPKRVRELYEQYRRFHDRVSGGGILGLETLAMLVFLADLEPIEPPPVEPVDEMSGLNDDVPPETLDEEVAPVHPSGFAVGDMVVVIKDGQEYSGTVLKILNDTMVRVQVDGKVWDVATIRVRRAEVSAKG